MKDMRSIYQSDMNLVHLFFLLSYLDVGFVAFDVHVPDPLVIASIAVRFLDLECSFAASS